MAMNQPNDDRRLQPVDHTPHELAPADMFTDERIELIRNSVAKGAPDDVFKAMIDIARTRGLDPMAKQIGVAQFDKNSGYQIYMPIDGYRAVAGDRPDFAGKDKPEYGPVVGKTPMGKPYPEWCSITVYRLVQGQRMAFTAEVWWEEFYGGERNRSWNKMPRVMLAKVAEAHALRMAFTRSLSGTYTPDEMDQASVEVQGRVVNRSSGEISDKPTFDEKWESYQNGRRASDARTPPQTRQDAPRAPIQAEVVESPPQAHVGTWEEENRRLHAIANDAGLDHAKLKVWMIAAALRKGTRIISTKEASPEVLRYLSDRIEGDGGKRVEKEATDALMNPDVYELYEQGEAEKALGKQTEIDMEEGEADTDE